MKQSRILFLLILFVLLFVEVEQTAFAQTLPAKVRTYLTENYSGWKQTAVASGCYASFKKSVIVGDFDKNGKNDYVVKFVQGRTGFFLAFLSSGSNYKPYLLESGTAAEIKKMGLNMSSKGEKMENEDGKVYKSPEDRPMIGICESHAGYYSFSNGDFRPL